MLGDRRKGKVEAVDEMLYWLFTRCQEVEDPPPIRVGDRMEDLLARLEHGNDYSVVST
jgi:hypothetical protein